MATDPSFIEYITDQSQLRDRLTHKKLFGEYALYLDGKVVAFACDNSLFVKPAAATRTLTASLPQRRPYPEAKPYPVADELLDDADALRALLLATERALPPPKPKSPKKRNARR